MRASQGRFPLRSDGSLLIFGNAKGGTLLMQSNPAIGIDLPLKALVWEDATGKTWLSYNDPSQIAKRYGLGADVNQTVDAMERCCEKSDRAPVALASAYSALVFMPNSLFSRGSVLVGSFSY
jgi:hypothetical protein